MLSKFTPDTVTVLICVAVAMVNDTVAVTPVAAITLLESITEGDVRVPAVVSLIIEITHINATSDDIFMMFVNY